MVGVGERVGPANGSPPRRFGRWSGTVTRNDLTRAGVVLALQLGLTMVAGRHHSTEAHPTPAEWALLVVGPLALLAARRRPVAVLWVTFAATLGPAGSRFAYVSLVVAFFLAAIGGHRRAAWIMIVVGYIGSLWVVPPVWGQRLATLDGALILGGWLAMLVVAAETVRLRRNRTAELRAVRQAEERRQVSEERLRMARDLHDVIGHNISLINVQAAVGLDLMDTQPEQARAALAAIKTVSKDALGELRALLGALRQDSDDAPRAPAPGLDQLDGLVASTRAAGLRVAVETFGDRRTLGAPMELTAYRIVQESLTNVARHAPGARAVVRIDYRPDDVRVEIADDGGPRSKATRGGPGAGPVTGNGGSGLGGSGIAGMRERALAVGGHLSAGPRPEGGFVVALRLPREEQP